MLHEQCQRFPLSLLPPSRCRHVISCLSSPHPLSFAHLQTGLSCWPAYYMLSPLLFPLLSLIILPLTHYSSSHSDLIAASLIHPAITHHHPSLFWNRTTNANWSPGNEARNHDTVDTFYACISSKSLFLVGSAHCTDSYSLLFILVSELEPIFLLIVS